MLNNRNFWIAQMIALSLFYIAAIALAISGQPMHWVVKVSILLLALHVLEIPNTIRILKPKQPSLPRLLVMTLLFGLVWWIPARRGLFQVK